MRLRALILLDGPRAIVVSRPTWGQLPGQTGPHRKPRFLAPVYMERRCCPFFEFALSIGGSDPSIRVALTGSAEVKAFLATELRSRVVPASALLR